MTEAQVERLKGLEQRYRWVAGSLLARFACTGITDADVAALEELDAQGAELFRIESEIVQCDAGMAALQWAFERIDKALESGKAGV